MAPAEQSLMRSMGLTPEQIERRKAYVGLTPDDVQRVVTLQQAVHGTLDEHVAVFFGWLAKQPEAIGLLEDRETLIRARKLKREHLEAMVRGEYGESYVAQRLVLAQLYSKVGIEQAVFLGAYNQLLASLEKVAGEQFAALRKVAFFDLALISDVLVHERERVIRMQSEAIKELSTPVLQLRERMLLMPIIGIVDTHRAQLIMENLLGDIRAKRARVVVMDVTGVSTIDSGVANHLLRTIAAARLMGANVIVTGISSDVATALVALGIALDEIRAVGDLQSGIEEAERLLATI
ncbi:MAG TPA: protoglobin domain-containing protein [Kofleriaceae bacterium]|nr:protoglobin domain-containing protein [Kofleriaceae bacterium]